MRCASPSCALNPLLRGAATETLSTRETPSLRAGDSSRAGALGGGSSLRNPRRSSALRNSVLHCDRAQALVETALVLPLLLLLIVGLFDVGRAIWLSNTLATAVREGTRYGVVHGALSGSPTGPGAPSYTAPDTDTTITAVVRSYSAGVPSNLTVLSTWPDGNANRGSRIVVSATFPFTPILSQVFLGGGLNITLRSSSTLVIEQ
jgi:Flp pilus assembly protein TadG